MTEAPHAPVNPVAAAVRGIDETAALHAQLRALGPTPTPTARTART